ncbi:MAG: hypothetical protein ACI94L_000972, partial [Flavobacteriaceae bacterium]
LCWLGAKAKYRLSNKLLNDDLMLAISGLIK